MNTPQPETGTSDFERNIRNPANKKSRSPTERSQTPEEFNGAIKIGAAAL